MDNPLMTLKNKGLDKTLAHLKQIAVDTNKEFSELLGVPVSAAITVPFTSAPCVVTTKIP